MMDRCGFPFVDTVSRTERAAMVRALAAIFGVKVDASDGDASILSKFRAEAGKEYTIGPVVIERAIIVPARPMAK